MRLHPEHCLPTGHTAAVAPHTVLLPEVPFCPRRAMPAFIEKLTKASQKNQSLLCIGLDPDLGLMPDNMKVIDFNQEIIDATL